MIGRQLSVCCMLVVLMLSGCASNRIGKAWPEPRALGRDITTYSTATNPAKEASSAQDIKEPSGEVTLSRVLALALMKNPELAAFSWEVRAGEARALQAGLLPNPEVEVEVEEYDAEGTGFDTAETAIVLSQLIELGGKRRKRVNVAKLERNLAGWDYEAKRLDVFVETAQAFLDVLAAQEQLALQKTSVALAEKVRNAVDERVKAGKVSSLEATKASVELSVGKIGLQRAERELQAARKRLAATWGSTVPAFTKATGDFETMISSIPSADQVLRHVSQNPDIARWQTEMELRRATLRLEKAGRIPDLTTTTGFQQFEATGDDALIFGLAFSFPLFDRNQGSIREARHLLSKAEKERLAAEVEIRTALTEAYQTLSSSHSEAVTLKNEVLPGAQQAFEAAEGGYKQGKFGYLDVLDAQRTLFESKAQYIESLSAYHKAVAELERLIGRSLKTVVEAKSQKK